MCFYPQSTKLTFDSIEKFLRIQRNVEALIKEGGNLAETGFFSEAHCKYSKVLPMIESEKEMLLKDHFKFYHYAYTLHCINTMKLYIAERRFEDMMDLYTKLPLGYDDADVTVARALRTLGYNLALMVIGKLEASKAALALYDFKRTNEEIFSMKSIWQPYIFEFCRLKKWDEALDLTNRVGRDLDSCPHVCNSHFLRVMIYVERYRVEALKRPKSQRNKMSATLYKYISIEMYKARKNINSSHHSYYLYLLSLQWTYLNRKGFSTSEADINGHRKLEVKSSSKTHFNFCSNCGQYTSFSGKTPFCNNCQEIILSRRCAHSLQGYLEKLIPTHVTSNSCSCCLAKLSEESALVCSGCRVACFCSLNHQRSSWKKDTRGLGIGHKMLCPLLKAQRKYNDAKRMKKDNVKEHLLRFDRECENFFSKTLGLEDLCFSREFIEKNDEGYLDLSTKSLAKAD